MKINILLLSFLFTLSQISFGQTLLLEENFDYVAGTSLTDNGWIAYSGVGSNSILVSSGSLSYTNYASSGVGNSANVIGTSTSSEDVKKTFPLQLSGSVYASFLVNFSSATTAADGDYFFGFFTSTGETARGLVSIKKSTPNIAFGISKTTNTPNFSEFSYSLNTTYLLVLKYTFNVSSSDDIISLFINPDLSGSEPAPDIFNVDVATDLSNIGTVFLRQGGAAYNLVLDGIRVSDSWNQAPLPVELTSFTATAIDAGVLLNWTTATEIKNYGFEIERVTNLRGLPNLEGFETIGFVEGHGNSNSPKDYSFLDSNPSSGTVSYRLKQLDTDGSFEYSDIVTVNRSLSKTELFQNHPNPFNPTTQISFALAEAGRVTISVFNMLGQKVAELVNQNMDVGTHNINFDGSNLSSGFYIYRLVVDSYGETPNYSKTMKMLLLK